MHSLWVLSLKCSKVRVSSPLGESHGGNLFRNAASGANQRLKLTGPASRPSEV
jgi:hypothetical protein